MHEYMNEPATKQDLATLRESMDLDVFRRQCIYAHIHVAQFTILSATTAWCIPLRMIRRHISI